MSDAKRDITDDMTLSELTVGEFKQLMQSLMLASANDDTPRAKIDPPIEKIAIRRKSLDEFMDDLGEK